MPSFLEALQNAVRGTYNGMSQAGQDLGAGIMDAATLPGDVYKGRVDLNSDEGFGRVMNLAGNVAGGGLTVGRAAPGGTNVGMFIGPQAKTFPTGDLVTESMGRAMGRSPEEIYKATGTAERSGIFRGEDGLPRVEIDDSRSRLRSAFLDNDSLQAPLGSVIDHPEFFKAYPDASNIQVHLNNRGNNSYALGYNNGNESALKINMAVKKDMPADEFHSTLLHEMQHYVQDKERFANGYNPTGPAITGAAPIQELQSALDAAKANANRMKSMAQDAVTRQESPKILERVKDGLVQADNTRKQADYALADAKYGAYARAMGEVEARNTQSRQFWDQAERNASYPPNWARMADPYAADQWYPGKTLPFPKTAYGTR